jgi:hypothetical protein
MCVLYLSPIDVSQPQATKCRDMADKAFDYSNYIINPVAIFCSKHKDELEGVDWL